MDHQIQETHVVTITLQFGDGKMPANIIFECMRGTRQECRDVVAHMPTASHDQRPLEWSMSGYAPVKDWEEFLKS